MQKQLLSCWPPGLFDLAGISRDIPMTASPQKMIVLSEDSIVLKFCSVQSHTDHGCRKKNADFNWLQVVWSFLNSDYLAGQLYTKFILRAVRSRHIWEVGSLWWKLLIEYRYWVVPLRSSAVPFKSYWPLSEAGGSEWSSSLPLRRW
jgi:hypothetical protein